MPIILLCVCVFRTPGSSYGLQKIQPFGLESEARAWLIGCGVALRVRRGSVGSASVDRDLHPPPPFMQV
jgi:hypothetical protein